MPDSDMIPPLRLSMLSRRVSLTVAVFDLAVVLTVTVVFYPNGFAHLVTSWPFLAYTWVAALSAALMWSAGLSVGAAWSFPLASIHLRHIRFLLRSVLLTAFSVGFLSYMTKGEVSRGWVLSTALAVFLLGGFFRVLLSVYLTRQRAHGHSQLNVLLCGSFTDVALVKAHFDKDPATVWRPTAYATNSSLPVPPEFTARLSDLVRVDVLTEPSSSWSDLVVGLASDPKFSAVVLCGSIKAQPGDLEAALHPHATAVLTTVSLPGVHPNRLQYAWVGGLALLHIAPAKIGSWRGALKRALDIVGSLVALVLSFPLVLGGIIALKIESHRHPELAGPMFFHQKRVGLDGQTFKITKLRTMVKDAEARKSEVEHLNEAGVGAFKASNDPRVTPVGSVLRSWSLDELPQFKSVLKGDMSLVGPRPPLVEEVEEYPSRWRRRLEVKPGLTGPWQVSGRSSLPFDQAVELDLAYAANWSLGADLEILVKTVWVVVSRHGAH